jgi:GNAT superfamily N-acetyltransferase
MVDDVIFVAKSAADYEAFAHLVTAYVEWLRIRFQPHLGFIDKVFSHQSLANELADLPTAYGPPNGKTLLLRHESEIAGGIAYRRLDASTCEMKRLFVFDRFKGRGYGRALCNALIAQAKDDGFTLMRLDTGYLLTEAIQMYQLLGFRACPAYHDYPLDLMQFLIFMERPLA